MTDKPNDAAGAHWAIAYHTNSRSPRAQKWYYVARVVKVDGQWWELYRLAGKEGEACATCNRTRTRDAALSQGLELLHGVFTAAPAPRHGGRMVWSVDKEAA